MYVTGMHRRDDSESESKWYHIGIMCSKLTMIKWKRRKNCPGNLMVRIAFQAALRRIPRSDPDSTELQREILVDSTLSKTGCRTAAQALLYEYNGIDRIVVVAGQKRIVQRILRL